MNLRQWLAVPYGGPRRYRAATALSLRDLADTLAAGPAGVFLWRWRVSLAVRALGEAVGRR